MSVGVEGWGGVGGGRTWEGWGRGVGGEGTAAC